MLSIKVILSSKIAQLHNQSEVSSNQNCKNIPTSEMRTICEEVNVIETFWPRQTGEMIIGLLKASKGTVILFTQYSTLGICEVAFFLRRDLIL